MHDKRTVVLFIIPQLVIGGGERVIVNLMGHLNRDRFSIYLAVLDMTDAILLSDVPSDVTIFDLKATRVRYALHKLLLLIWKLRPDIIFSTADHLSHGLAVTRFLWPMRSRFIVRRWGRLSASFSGLRWKRLRILAHRTFAWCPNMTVFQSEDLKHDYFSTLKMRECPNVVIENPVDICLVRQLAANEPKWPIFNKAMYNVVAAGRLSYEKGFDLLINAIANVTNKNVRLTIIGEGPARKDLEHQICTQNISDRVLLAGLQANPYQFFRAADLFVLSSRYEAFPNVVLEALACGTPVVATRIPSLAPLLVEIPECDMVPVDSPMALSAAIEKYSRLGRRRVADHVVEAFDVDQVCRKYEKLFGRLTTSSANSNGGGNDLY